MDGFASPLVNTAVYHKINRKKMGSLDGYVLRDARRAKILLVDEKGNSLANRRLAQNDQNLQPGNSTNIGFFSCDVLDPVEFKDFESGKLFAQPQAITSDTTQLKATLALPRRPIAPRRPLGASGIIRKRPLSSTHVECVEARSDRVVLNVGQRDACPVCLEPFLQRVMQPHQIEGVKFMFECVAGLRDNGYGSPLTGCILAHSMGLGKSLQALALTYTLLHAGVAGHPMIQKAIIVCPASLCNNWVSECRRWLGTARIEPLVLTSGKNAARLAYDFVTCAPQKLLITSYETLRCNVDILSNAPIGVILCDEGHRLKNSNGNATTDAILAFRGAKRVLLTGTPGQNDLDELWALCEIASPGALPPLTNFREIFANPISNSQQAGATDEQRRLAESRSAELRRLCERLIQKRDRSIIEQSLPARHDLIICCSLESQQTVLYRNVLKRLRKEQGSGGAHLHSIMALRGVSSSGSTSGLDNVQDDNIQTSGSGKLALIFKLLPQLIAAGDRFVLVSQFKSTLDGLECGFRKLELPTLRIDGSVTPAARQEIVDRFNKRDSNFPIFLLSSRAGGTGFNLTSANRLVLVEPDWNPAVDEQAISRIFRQGQKREVFIWRLLSSGTIEEKIFERQLFKNDLTSASETVSDSELAFKLDPQSWREIFSFDERVKSSTLRAMLRVSGRRSEEVQMSRQEEWLPQIDDVALRTIILHDDSVSNLITFASDIQSLCNLRRDAKSNHRRHLPLLPIDSPCPSPSSRSNTPTGPDIFLTDDVRKRRRIGFTFEDDTDSE